VSNIFLIVTESEFPGSLGSLTFEDAASDFKKKPQTRNCIILLMGSVAGPHITFHTICVGSQPEIHVPK